jgi:hypothetical protein
MDNYLLRQAIDNVWCNPADDNQFTYALQQLTPRYGVRGNYVVEQNRYFMPTNNNRDYYHVYQIGQVIPANVGMGLLRRDTWIALKDLASDHLTLASVYQTNGIRYSMSETYVMVTSRENLLVAVKLSDRFPTLDDHQIFLHLYHNAYFESKRSTTANRRWIFTESIVAVNQDAIRQLQIRNMDTIAAKGGVGMYFVNGRPVHEISIVTAVPGDHCDFILDGSIRKVITFPVSNLKTFNSTLDSQRKYILHYTDSTANKIDFYDDISIHLVKQGTTADQFKGVTYHHNDGIWLRQLTHKDYSMPVAKVQQLVAENDEWTDASGLLVKMYIREGGYDRPLVADASRIWELYRLTSTQILNNMTGVDALNPLWRAENLEQSAYVRFMSADPKFIYPITFNEPELNTQGKVDAQNFAAEVYGYYGCGKLLADNPAKVIPDPMTGVRRADLAFYYWRDCTVFEYDVAGELLGYYYHPGGRQYFPRYQSCTMVECIAGKGSDNLNGVYGNTEVPIKYGYNFRVYVTKVWGGVPTNEWRDITDAEDRDQYGFFDDDLYSPKWVWTIPANQYLGYVRTDEYFYLKEIRFLDTVGLLRFQIAAWEDMGAGLVNKPLEIPFGQLDLIQNNRALIQGLDFFDDGDLIVINNLEYRSNLGVQTVLVRGSGFCGPDLKRLPPSEFGFVEYGVLSNDSTYHIHQNKMQRIVVDGHYKDYRDVVFEEARNGLTVQNERNGAPFQVQTPQVTLKTVFKDDLKARREDDERDQWTSDAMGYYFPKRVRANPDNIPRHYHVFSSYSQKILTEILAGRLAPPFVNGRYTDMDIVNQLKQYEWLKPFDILNREYNTNHVKVYPHWFESPVALTDDQYDYYRRILKLMLRQEMELSPFIYITRT